jgi:hypothetical protein
MILASLCSVAFAGDAVSPGGGQRGYWQRLSKSQWVDPQGRRDTTGGLFNVNPSAGWRIERRVRKYRWHGESKSELTRGMIWAPGPENEFFRGRMKAALIKERAQKDKFQPWFS